MTTILTHRGLDPSRPRHPGESTLEAFVDHLTRGYGLEFDVSLLGDGTVVVTHDTSLTRITQGGDSRSLCSLGYDEFLKFGGIRGTLGTFSQVVELLPRGTAHHHAVHVKGLYQEPHYLDALISAFSPHEALFPKLLFFDLLPAAARRLKEAFPTIRLAPSVAHPYDIARYNKAVHGTLMSLEQALAHRELFAGIWVDEWDTLSADGIRKEFCTPELITRLKSEGLLVGVVTPELHATSPGLLSTEAHSDALTQPRLFVRIAEILEGKPDLVCTDYPDDVQALVV